MTHRLLFVSPRFLFPADSGGRIRTTQILRGMKGAAFEITLVSPAPTGATDRFAEELNSVCDLFVAWPQPRRGRLFPLARLRHLLSGLPVPVATDRSAAGLAVVAAELARKPDVVVFDFAHAVVLAPDRIDAPSVMFTHNVEAEIFERHARVAVDGILRAMWANQHRKMLAFEAKSLRRFDSVVAVADRDKEGFSRLYGLDNVAVIPPAVDVEYFTYDEPGDEPRLIYVGSMDSMANIDAMHHFMDDIWPMIVAGVPAARMKVIGRAPPASLVKKAAAKGIAWEFTGYVDDVRDHVRGAAVHVVPLRVGGGTRIKVFEGLAMGVPMVSTTIGVEGLDVTPGEHYLNADTPSDFANATIRLLEDAARRRELSKCARRHVVANFTASVAAAAFEKICLGVRGPGNRTSSDTDTSTTSDGKTANPHRLIGAY